MNERIQHVIDTDARSVENQVAVCRAVLEVLAIDIDTFQTDVPFADEATWPAEVTEAARFLSALKEPGRGENDLYRRTGELQRNNEVALNAFIVFAPYAYDADAHDHEGRELLSLADVSHSMVASLNAHQVEQLTERMPAGILVPLNRWRK